VSSFVRWEGDKCKSRDRQSETMVSYPGTISCKVLLGSIILVLLGAVMLPVYMSFQYHLHITL